MDVVFNPKVSNENEDKAKMAKLLSSDEFVYNNFANIKNRVNFHGYGEMCKFVEENIQKLLTSAIDKKPKALQIVTDKDFLIAMDICDGSLNLNKDYINRFNRVYRSYVINPSKNVIYNDTSASLLYKVSLKLNKKVVSILQGIGLSEKDALWLVVNRYSSTDERRNIRRIVRSMQHMDPYIMTEQMVVNIFAKLFNDQLTNLFCAIMTDRFDSFESEDEKYVYSTVSNALLDILNTMDIDDIKDILMEYQDELRKSGITGRFSLNSINSGDYGSICQAIAELEDLGIAIN